MNGCATATLSVSDRARALIWH